MITAPVSVSGVFLIDVSSVPADSGLNAIYEKIPFSFITINDTIDLTTGWLNKLKTRIQFLT